MTCTPILDKEGIAKAFETLRDAFQSSDGAQERKVCGHPAYFLKGIKLFGAFGELTQERKYWVGFGSEGEEKKPFGANIAMEGSKEGSKREGKREGLFVKDKEGRVFLTHRGILPYLRRRGNHSREAFRKFTRPDSWIKVEKEQHLKFVIVRIDNINPSGMIDQIAQVTEAVREFRNSLNSQMPSQLDNHKQNSHIGDSLMTDRPKILNTILYGPPGTGKTYATLRRCVEICEGPLNDLQDDEIRRRYNMLVKDRRVEFITFHQSYSYEEFIEGLRPKTKSNAGFRLVPTPGVLKRIADRARQTSFSLARPQVFKMSLGRMDTREYKYIFEQSIENGCALLGHGGDVDWSDSKFDRDDEIDRHWSEAGLKSSSDFPLTCLKGFRNSVKKGDLLIVQAKGKKFRGIGEVIGYYEYSPETEYHHHRNVLWHWIEKNGRPAAEICRKNLTQKTIYKLKEEDIIWEKLFEHIGGEEKLSKTQLQEKLSTAQPYVLIIDEINRANISKVMGEMITLLEEDKREGEKNEVVVRLPYSDDPFTLPANLHILGTMNTADRSIALIDTALRRRFQFEELAPDPSKLKEDVDGIKLREVLMAINDRLEYLIDRDHLIGHAWLMQAETKADVDRIMRHKIIPLIAEYFYDDWRKVSAVLGDTDDFIQRKKLQRPPGLEEAEADEDRYRWTVKKEEFPLEAYSHLIEGKEGKRGSGGSED